MKSATIIKLEKVVRNICYVSLSNMRADISQCLKIDVNDIPFDEWFDVDENNYSVSYDIREGVKIWFDNINEKSRKIINPRFKEK